MIRCAAVVLALAGLAAAAGFASAQSVPGPMVSVPSGTRSGVGLPLNSADIEKLRDLVDRDHGLTGRELASAKKRAKEESTRLVSADELACEVTDAERVGGGKGTAGGKSIDVNVYEVACANGMGYFLVSQGAERPVVLSCFAAEATHAADAATGKMSESFCQLPANKDVKATATSMLSTAGRTCAVSNFRWFGMNAAERTEYSEVACADGKGYLMKIPQSRPAAQASVMSCEEAAKQGLKCHLTDVGAVSAPVTMQTLRDALKQHGVDCEAAQLRLVGRESVRRRYVVEVQCPGQPQGMVTFIPLADNPNEFESLDCAAAVERQVTCELKAN